MEVEKVVRPAWADNGQHNSRVHEVAYVAVVAYHVEKVPAEVELERVDGARTSEVGMQPTAVVEVGVAVGRVVWAAPAAETHSQGSLLIQMPTVEYLVAFVAAERPFLLPSKMEFLRLHRQDLSVRLLAAVLAVLAEGRQFEGFVIEPGASGAKDFLDHQVEAFLAVVQDKVVQTMYMAVDFVVAFGKNIAGAT